MQQQPSIVCLHRAHHKQSGFSIKSSRELQICRPILHTRSQHSHRTHIQTYSPRLPKLTHIRSILGPKVLPIAKSGEGGIEWLASREQLWKVGTKIFVYSCTLHPHTRVHAHSTHVHAHIHVQHAHIHAHHKCTLL